MYPYMCSYAGWRVIHLVLHPLVFWCISLYIYIHNTYTCNPNDTCFDWKRPCFGGGWPQKDRGHLASRYIYIYTYIHKPMYQYNIPHWCFFFLQSSPFQLDLPKARGDMEAEVGDITFVLAERGHLQFRQRGKPQPKRAQTPWYDDNCFRGWRSRIFTRNPFNEAWNITKHIKA